MFKRLKQRLRRHMDTTDPLLALQQQDPWFYSHYVYAADMVAARLGQYLDLSRSHLFDFGCGDGIMALGVSRHTGGSVTGFDITQAFSNLPERARQTLGMAHPPANLHYVRVDENKPLPFADRQFDGGYTWSVFEHVDNVAAALAEAHRILKPDAIFFLQIEPLYYSPFGSHLQRLINEPWAHLLTDETDYLQRAYEAKDHVPDTEKDMLYRENEFAQVKSYLVSEYKTLNKITVRQLIAHVQATGFNILQMQTQQIRNMPIPGQLLKKLPAYDLITNEILLTLSK